MNGVEAPIIIETEPPRAKIQEGSFVLGVVIIIAVVIAGFVVWLGRLVFGMLLFLLFFGLVAINTVREWVKEIDLTDQRTFTVSNRVDIRRAHS